MKKKKRQKSGDINRIYIDRRQRSEGYLMGSQHSHPYFELCCIEHGVCRFYIEQSFYDLKTGDCLLIPPHLVHYTDYLSGSCLRSGIYFRLSDVQDDTAAMLPGDFAFLSEPHLVHVPEPYMNQFKDLLTRMVQEESIDDAVTALLLKARLQELFLFLIRCYSFQTESSGRLGTLDQPIRKAILFINSHFRENIDAAAIATAAGFSPNHLSRKFRLETGLGVHEYLTSVRLKNAALELISTDYSITEIATHCGFSDGNYFKDVFKKHYALTPRQYRKDAQTPQP